MSLWERRCCLVQHPQLPFWLRSSILRRRQLRQDAGREGSRNGFGRRWALTRDDMASTGKVPSITRINECNSIFWG